jgi:DNA-binding MarR family transcriptional regulator
MSEATVFMHIQKLIDAGIVREVVLDDDQRRQGYPWKVYGLTEEGRELLDAPNLLAAEETLQQIYDTISDKPEKIITFENAPSLTMSSGTVYFCLKKSIVKSPDSLFGFFLSCRTSNRDDTTPECHVGSSSLREDMLNQELLTNSLHNITHCRFDVKFESKRPGDNHIDPTGSKDVVIHDRWQQVHGLRPNSVSYS